MAEVPKTLVEQVAIAERLQLKLLTRFETMIDEGTLTATDAATLVRLLSANGWTLDPAKVPKNLQNMLTTAVSFAEDGDDPVVGKIGAA